MDPVPPVSVITPKPKSKVPLIIVGGIIIFSLGIALGLFFGKNLYSQPAIEPTPTPIAKATPTPNPTANWKTYINKNLGVIFKYPNSWVITETDMYVVVLKDPDMRTVIGACPGYSFSVSKYDPLLNYSRFDRVTKSELNGEPTVIWENDDSKCKEKVILINDLPSSLVKPKYIISFMSNNPDGKKVVDQILATFKFIDQKEMVCGGIAGVICPDGYNCKYDGDYPDASGICIKN
ncbi:MAG: hypothetical protein AAB768_02535 [Patescibacteria group bacterium]